MATNPRPRVKPSVLSALTTHITKSLPTRKHVRLQVRDPESGTWATEEWDMTSFNLNYGTLALFYRGVVQRICAPGDWGDLELINESKIDGDELKGIVEDAAEEVPAGFRE